MASILLITSNNEGLSLGLQLQMEGHIVKVIDDTPLPPHYQGKIDSLTSLPTEYLSQFDLVVGLTPSDSYYLDQAIKMDRPTICGNLLSYRYGTDEGYTNLINEALSFTSSKAQADHQVTFWYDGKEKLFPQKHLPSFRLLEGERGPVVGCNVLCTIPLEDVIPQLPERFEEVLQLAKYKGMILLNLSAEGELLSFQLGTSYLHLYTFLESCKGIFDTLYYIAGRGRSKERQLREEPCLALAFYGAQDAMSKMTIEDPAIKHVHFHAPGIGCVTARGISVNECRRRVYRTIRKLSLPPEFIYRLDAGLTIEDKMKGKIDYASAS